VVTIPETGPGADYCAGAQAFTMVSTMVALAVRRDVFKRPVPTGQHTSEEPCVDRFPMAK